LALQVNPLQPLFAAEMLGADLRPEPSAELVAAVNDAMARYAVLVIRDQSIDDAQQIRFARRFGPLELPPHQGLQKDAHGARRISNALYDVSNLGADGNLLPQDSLRHASIKANEEFHTDSSFNMLPTKWSLLMGHVIPPERGDTDYIDTRAVWDALPPALKARAHGAVAEHYFWKTRGRTGYTVTEDMKRAMPPARHNLVRVIPESGREALYIGEHTTHILGWPREEGEAFLSELNRFAMQPQFRYTHKWRRGDLVIWDNRCTLHRASGYDVFRYKRDLRRATINEYGPEISSTDAIGVAPPN
jgi:alpha-ketoglutarate-dependent 2,4-dichlorophenoxyacetate dioxygenase